MLEEDSQRSFVITVALEQESQNKKSGVSFITRLGSDSCVVYAVLFCSKQETRRRFLYIIVVDKYTLE